jgi:acetyl esterase/lipase
MRSGDRLGPVSTLAQPLPDAVVRYAAHDDGLLDVHLPPDEVLSAGSPRVVLLLHGGFWRQAYDRRHTRAVAADLASRGCVVVTPEYRRVGGEGGWPRTLEDAGAVTRDLPRLLGGLDLSVGRLSVVGHSAGGHLALWLANEKLPDDAAPGLVVGLAPVCDLHEAATLGLGAGATQAFLGGPPETVPDRYAAADPAVRLGSPPACTVRVVHGEQDEVVPATLSRSLRARHPYVDLRVVAGADHFDLIDPTSRAWASVLEALDLDPLAPPGPSAARRHG